MCLKPLPWVYNDGGRSLVSKGKARDCVTRAVAIVTGLPYETIYEAINEESMRERPRAGRKRSSAREGVLKATTRRYLASLGAVWHPTMAIGSGCKVHLRVGEIPSKGRLIVKVSKHVCAVIDGVIYNTHDPSREGNRCVYGWYVFPEGKTRTT
jgi:hypothetical protein